jgi:TRAP-type mannitol/chloroaromatic compound transport system permease large subunit
VIAGAIGALAAIVVGVVRGKLAWPTLRRSCSRHALSPPASCSRSSPPSAAIRYGSVSVLAIEIGLSVFVVKGALPKDFVSLGDIFLGAAPFPQISLVLL